MFIFTIEYYKIECVSILTLPETFSARAKRVTEASGRNRTQTHEFKTILYHSLPKNCNGAEILEVKCDIKV